jgi:hypothetical protein
MKNRILNVAIAACAIVVLAPLFGLAQIPTQRPAPSTPTIRVQDVLSLVTFTPKVVQLKAGGDPVVVKVTIGIRIHNVSVQIFKDGIPQSVVVAKTEKEWQTSGSISLQAAANATIAADYLLKISASAENQQNIEVPVPGKMLSIEVIPIHVKLTRINPSAGERGTTAVMEGNDFLAMSPLSVCFTGTDASQNESAQIIEKTNSTITLKIPRRAESGKIELTLGTGTTAVRVTSDFIFTVPQRPAIESFSPDGGPPGTTVEIRGYNFFEKGGSPIFKFSNERSATSSGASGGYLGMTDQGPIQSQCVIVPAGSVTGPIKVLTPKGTGVSVRDFRVPTILTSPPVITRFRPGGGKIGTDVQIYGQNFGRDHTGVSVKFGSQSVSVNPRSCRDDMMDVRVPEDARMGKISVATSGGSTSSTDTYFFPPEIKNVTPPSGPVGYQITIVGMNFDPSNKSAHVVKINGIQAKVIDVGDTKIVIEIPTGATTGPLTLETPGGLATGRNITVVQ